MKKNLNYYLILLAILNIGAFGFYLLRYNPLFQAWTLIITSIFYVLWSLIHHHLEGDLHPKVLMEYLLMVLLVNLIILSLIFRA